MSKVFLHRRGFPDKLLGRVNEEGRITRSEAGPDEEIGYVDLGTGKVYLSLVRPGTYAGRVQLETGKVFRHVPHGPDEYLGEVHENGKMFRHVSAWPDKYVGNMPDFISLAHSGAAFLLLVLPAIDET
jgi:hypothetical protein